MRVKTNNKYLAIHPLVEIALRFWMKENDELCHWLKVATVILDRCFPRDLYDVLLPHAQRVIDTSIETPKNERHSVGRDAHIRSCLLAYSVPIGRSRYFHM